MKLRIPTIALLLFFSSFNMTANQINMTKTETLQSIQKLESKTLYFGHQSVGQNIIDGIQDILDSASGVKLQLVEMGESFTSPQDKGYIVHSAVGENTKPVSKCEDFNQIIRNKLASSIDIAMLKFCYIDINENTNVDALFQQYQLVMDQLIQDFPQITFIHITTPLRHSETGPSIWLRELVGKFTNKPNRSKLANIKRNEFNDLLKSHYAGSPIFDLAQSMSTTRDGTANTFTYHGNRPYYHLIDAFTDDGGHLNNIGRKKVAEDFLQQVAKMTLD